MLIIDREVIVDVNANLSFHFNVAPSPVPIVAEPDLGFGLACVRVLHKQNDRLTVLLWRAPGLRPIVCRPVVLWVSPEVAVSL
jgi:hypothetical protein